MRRRLLCVLLLLALLPLPALGAEEEITRGEFLLLMWADAGSVPYDITAHPFTDLTGRDDLAQAAGWAWELGLVNGVGEGLFAPDRLLTREECAALLRRRDARLGLDVWLPDGAAACNDYADISPWADDSLYWACIMGRMDFLNCRLAPCGHVTKQEAEDYLCLLFSFYSAGITAPVMPFTAKRQGQASVSMNQAGSSVTVMVPVDTYPAYIFVILEHT